MLIVIEGVDGSGKQTQTELLLKKLKDSGKKAVKLTFPNYEGETSALVKMYLSGKFGKDADAVNPYAASIFYAADRIGSYLETWKQYIDNDTIVICDRYTTSNAIHQACKLKGEERDKYLDWLFPFEYDLLGLPKPDHVIFLNMPPEYGEQLTKNRANKITGGETQDIHESNRAYIENSYNSALYTAKKFNWKVIDCVEQGKIKSIEEINNEITEVLF
ncbi:MAG: thymidylate kinase [Clostridia bacterium]|nr:thymidylate kinase [Clostridia bacterium]